MHRSIATCMGAAVVAAAAGTPLLAQETGVVRGTVTLQETGGFVRGAVILVVGSGAFALTDEQGRFEIDGVPPGEYEVLAQREHLTAGRRTVIVGSREAATADFVLALSPVREEVTVTASAGGTETALEAFNAVSTLEAFDVARESASDLASALEHEPGIAIRSFGPGANRPIIRGFDGDRVLILQDGIRTGDLSGESGDHGVAVDPNGAERIEIVRGPATLLYGSNAVGGLVNVITPHASHRGSRLEGMRGQMSADLGSANAQAGADAALQHTRNGVHYWAAGTTRRTEDYTTPEGIVENSATESSGARAGVGWSRDRLFASAGVTFDDGRYGVPVAGEFHGHHEEGHGGPGDHHGETAIALDWQRRALRFDVDLQGLANRVVEEVQLSLNVIDWRHDELEIEQAAPRASAPTTTTGPTIVRADLDQRQTGRLSGRFGAWAQVRRLRGRGSRGVGAADRSSSSFAAFAFEELSLGRSSPAVRRSGRPRRLPAGGAHRPDTGTRRTTTITMRTTTITMRTPMRGRARSTRSEAPDPRDRRVRRRVGIGRPARGARRRQRRWSPT